MITPLAGWRNRLALIARLALFGGAAALCGNPVIAGAEGAHHSRNPRDPHERTPPPDFFRDFENGVRSTEVLAVAMEKPYFAKKFPRRHAEEFGDARVLQWRDTQIVLCENRGNGANDTGAEFAVGVEEEPAARVATLAIGVNINKGDHGVTPRLSSF